MKITCIAPSEIPSNTANSIQVMKTCQSMSFLNHDVQLLTPGRKTDNPDALWSHYGIQHPFDIQWIMAKQSLKKYDLAIKSLHIATSRQSDLIYTWMPQVAALSSIQRIPIILEMHDLPTGRMGPHLFKQFVRSSSPKKLVCITEALYRRLREIYTFSLPENEIVIAPNGTDMHRYENLPEPKIARKQLDLPDGFTIGYTGHFYTGRGMELMLRLLPKFPEINFLFVGGQPEKVNNWQALLKEKQLTNAYATGFIKNENLPLYQAACDVLLMPYERAVAGSSGGNSADICSPMKMFDYLAAGRAIISSDLPVIHEVLNENNAVFCPPEDIDAWSEAISELYKNSEKRSMLGVNAKQDAHQFDWTARANKILEGFNL